MHTSSVTPTIDNCKTFGLAVSCLNPQEREQVERDLQDKGLRLGPGTQPRSFTAVRVYPDGTFDRVWNVHACKYVTFKEFKDANTAVEAGNAA